MKLHDGTLEAAANAAETCTIKWVCEYEDIETKQIAEARKDIAAAIRALASPSSKDKEAASHDK